MKRITNILLAFLTLSAPVLISSPAYAASASMYLSPAATSVAQGGTLTVGVYENSGSTAVNAASAVLKYPASLLDFASITSSSAFSIEATSTGGGGSVHIERGTALGKSVTGAQLIASVSFRAKSSSGTASITFSSGNVISSKGSKNIAGSKSGGVYTLSKAAPAAAASPGSKPKPKDKTAPTLKDIATTDVGYKSATVTWTTSEPATSEVEYGLSDSYGITAVSSKRMTQHKIKLNSAVLIPATTYHYRVKSVDAAGNAVASKDFSFTTDGVPLAVTVLNQGNKKPVEKAKVEIGGSSATTDKNGKATLNLKEGKAIGVVTYKGKQTAVNVEIQPVNLKNPTQNTTFTIEVPKTNPWIIILPLLLLLLLVGTALMKRNPKLKAAVAKYLPGKNSNTPPSITSKPSDSPPTNTTTSKPSNTTSNVTPNSTSSKPPTNTASSSASSGPTIIRPTSSK